MEGDNLDAECEAYFSNSLMPQALPVFAMDGDDGDSKTELDDVTHQPPASAFEYLQRVRAESSQFADTCTVAYKEKSVRQNKLQRQHQYSRVDKHKSSAALLKMFSERDKTGQTPDTSILKQEERDFVVSLFESSRVKTELYKVQHAQKCAKSKIKMPKLRNCAGWLKFCLSSEVVGSMSKVCASGEGSEPAASPLNVRCSDPADTAGSRCGEDSDRESCASDAAGGAPAAGSDCESSDGSGGSSDTEDGGGGGEEDRPGSPHSTLPLLSVIALMNQEMVNAVIEHLLTTLKDGYFHSRVGNWLFALLACLPIPLPASQVAVLRQLVRYCKQIRSKLAPQHSEDYLAGLNILITIVSHNFGQKDLMDPL